MDRQSNFLEHIPLFQGFSPAQLKLLRPYFYSFDCHSGYVLFEQGEPAEYLYVIISGEVIIHYKPYDGPRITLAHVRSGGLVGWSAALGRDVYTSGAVCILYSQMLRVSGADLRRLCDQHTETGKIILNRLASLIAQRSQNSNNQIVDLLKQGLANGHS